MTCNEKSEIKKVEGNKEEKKSRKVISRKAMEIRKIIPQLKNL